MRPILLALLLLATPLLPSASAESGVFTITPGARLQGEELVVTYHKCYILPSGGCTSGELVRVNGVPETWEAPGVKGDRVYVQCTYDRASPTSYECEGYFVDVSDRVNEALTYVPRVHPHVAPGEWGSTWVGATVCEKDVCVPVGPVQVHSVCGPVFISREAYQDDGTHYERGIRVTVCSSATDGWHTTEPVWVPWSLRAPGVTSGGEVHAFCTYHFDSPSSPRHCTPPLVDVLP